MYRNNFDDQQYTAYEEVSSSSFNSTHTRAAFQSLLRKVYSWMALALTVTGLTAYYVASAYDPVTLLSGGALWVCIIAELALVFVISGMINRISFSTAGLLFIVYSILNGLTLSIIFVAYTHSSIAHAFFITAGSFAALSLVGYITKRDLGTMGRFLFMALIGLIIASVVNMFVHSTGLYWATSIFGVLIFAGLTAWDTQKIKQMFLTCGYDVNEQTQKLALLGSLTLYLDFINLFLYLLRFFGNRND